MSPNAAALADWEARFRHFAAVECTQDSLYVALCLAVADSPELLALLAEAPKTQALPNLLLAVLHERVLAGVAHGFADYYPSVGGQRLPDAELPAVLLDFVRRERGALVAHLRTRSTQTNEIGRCAVLWPALQHIAEQTGKSTLALFDFGCSAGLNLGVDAYVYRYQSAQTRFEAGALGEPGRPVIDCAWLGTAPPLSVGSWRLVERLGADPAPIDVHDVEACRWLAACLWPYDLVRAQRLQQALAIARAQPHRRVLQSEDCVGALQDWLQQLPAGVQPVVFNSWVLHYFAPDAVAQMRQRLAALMQQGDLMWLSAESPQLRPPGLELPALAEGATASTLWTLQWAESGTLQQRALAWSHPHGRWLQWLA